jgi:hypothetical protein
MGGQQSHIFDIESKDLVSNVLCVQDRRESLSTVKECRISKRRMSIEPRVSVRRGSAGNYCHDNHVWSSQQDAALEAAVLAVADQQYIKAPLHRDMQAAWRDGTFSDHSFAVFWARVAKLVPPRTKEACFLRYYLIIRRRVVRFSVK